MWTLVLRQGGDRGGVTTGHRTVDFTTSERQPFPLSPFFFPQPGHHHKHQILEEPPSVRNLGDPTDLKQDPRSPKPDPHVLVQQRRSWPPVSTPHLLLPKVDEVLQVKVIPVMHDGTVDDLADLPTSLRSGTSTRLSPNRTGWGSSRPHRSPPTAIPYRRKRSPARRLPAAGGR